VDSGTVDPVVREQTFNGQTELVGRALAKRLQTPASNELAPLEDTQHDVGVANVNR
jgi:hypothetical protein